MELLAWEKILECVTVALAFATGMLFATPKLLGVLQQCAYSEKKLFAWADAKNNMIWERILLLTLCFALAGGVLALCFAFMGEYAALWSVGVYLAFFVVYALADKKKALKCPAVSTPRYRRLQVICFVVFFIISYAAVVLLNFAHFAWGNAVFTRLRYLPLAIFPVLMLPLVCLSSLIAKIYEIPHNKSYVKKAKQKLKNSSLHVIAITGSYGKTSVKNILATLLQAKYSVLCTPASYNTPMGVAKTIMENDLSAYQILIVEMGARNQGDIRQLCELFPPQTAIITGICPQHLQTFGTMETLVATKAELLTAAKGKSYIAQSCYSLFPQNKATCCNCVSDVFTQEDKTQFTLTLGEKSVRTECKLLGAPAAENVGIAAQVAYDLGLTHAQIDGQVRKLEYIQHRLQLIKQNGVNIIDDAYNANVVGAKTAIAVLNGFAGRKACITPGIVELGVLEEEQNREFGASLVGLDLVVLVGETLVAPIKQGYLDADGDKDKLFILPTLEEAKQKLSEWVAEGDTVLFLNDLPDAV